MKDWNKCFLPSRFDVEFGLVLAFNFYTVNTYLFRNCLSRGRRFSKRYEIFVPRLCNNLYQHEKKPILAKQRNIPDKTWISLSDVLLTHESRFWFRSLVFVQKLNIAKQLTFVKNKIRGLEEACGLCTSICWPIFNFRAFRTNMIFKISYNYVLEASWKPCFFSHISGRIKNKTNLSAYLRW